MKRNASSGFTMTEMMMAVVISVLVFGALGTLLTRCFFMWLDGQAQWKLAQHARVARTQLLNGGFGVGTGLLSASNVTVSAYGSWTKVTFAPVGSDAYSIYGWPGNSMLNIWLQDPDGNFAWAQEVSKYDPGASKVPSVLVNHFTAAITNQKVVMTYDLNLLAVGRTNTLPQRVEVHLVNGE